jgi:hypothetical protein
MSNNDYAVTKSTARNLTAKSRDTLHELCATLPGLWDDGLAIILNVKDQRGYYPTYEGFAGQLKEFSSYKLLGSDISQQTIKNTLGIAQANKALSYNFLSLLLHQNSR